MMLVWTQLPIPSQVLTNALSPVPSQVTPHTVPDDWNVHLPVTPSQAPVCPQPPCAVHDPHWSVPPHPSS
jgi:hypothetical protein